MIDVPDNSAFCLLSLPRSRWAGLRSSKAGWKIMLLAGTKAARALRRARRRTFRRRLHFCLCPTLPEWYQKRSRPAGGNPAAPDKLRKNAMKITSTAIPEVVLIEPRVFQDER